MSTTLLNFFHGWPWYAVWLVALGFGGGMIVPAIYALAGAVWPQGGRQTFNAIYLAQNLGVAIGAASGGFVAELSFNYIFIANLLMYVAFAIVAMTQFKINLDVKVKSTDAMSLLSKAYRPQFIALTLLCVMFTQEINISMSQYSLLWTVNGIMILVAQPLILPVIRLLKGNLKYQMLVGIVIFILSFFVTSFAEQFSIFMVAMIILTLGEMFVWPAVPTIANQLAPKGKEGSFQGYVNSAATVGKAFGPLIGGVVVDSFNMQAMFLSMIVLLLIALVFLLIYDKKLPKDT